MASGLRASIFIKLVVTMLVAGLAVNFLVGAFFRYFFMSRNQASLATNIMRYTDYIIEDIGVPPDTGRAAEIARLTGLDISIEGTGFSWHSPGRLRLAEKPHETHRLPDGSIAWDRGRFIYRKNHRFLRYVFSSRPDAVRVANHVHLFVLILALSLIIGTSYFIIRKILLPVRRLTGGMREVSGGNLDFEVAAGGNDEIGELARTFNEMRGRIRAMLRAREQLLLDVSHELRSPLTRIKVALEYVGEGEARASIAQDVREMEAMLTEILETERLDRDSGAIHKEELSLRDLIAEVAAEMKARPGEVTAADGGDSRIYADRRLLKMLFRNLLENALKFSEGTGQPVVTAVRMEGGRALAEVRDRGIGIPAEEIPLLFEPFYRVDPSRSKKTGGYGLGLALCKKIAEAHGGSIEIESAPGVGTTVRVILPCRDINEQR